MSKDALETEMESSEDDKKHEHIPLLPQGKRTDSFKYADDDDEETELKEKKTAYEIVEETEMKSSEDENNDENSPLLSQEMEMKENKSLGDGAEEIEKKSTDGSVQDTAWPLEKRKEMKKILQEMMAPIHHAAKRGHSEVVTILLKGLEPFVRTRDEKNCLDIAIEKKHVETVMELKKNEKWKKLLRNKSDGNQSPMRKLIVHMPGIAREVFDECTTTKGTADKFEVEFDYQLLDDTLQLGSWTPTSTRHRVFIEGEPYTKDANEIKRNHPLMIMVANKRTELLDHPLVSALLKKKLTGVGLILYLFNVFLYVLYLMMLTGFALDIKAPFTFIEISVDVNVCFEDHNISEFAIIAKHCVIVSASIELFIEILEFIVVFSSNVRLYLSEKENILEWIACICSILFVVNTSGCTDTGYRPEWQWTCGIISVFLVWINLLLLMQQFPWFGIYVDMLYQSSQVFMKFMPVFSFLIAAFAVTFHCLFQNQEQFSTFWISFVKTTGMMIGELDFNKIFLEEEVHFRFISYVFFYVFMLVIAIVVVNLMVGLAVDMPKFQTNADLSKKKMQVKLALELERFSTYWIFKNCFRWLYVDNQTTKETFRPINQNWFKRKIGESWKLTEKDMKEAKTSGTVDLAEKISELKKEMKTEIRNEVNTIKTDMQEEIKSLNSKLTTIIQNLQRLDKENADTQPTDKLK